MKSIRNDGQPTFAGFPEAGFRFLESLKKHNDRDWFRERKSQYQELVEQPMASLVRSVEAGGRTHKLPLYAKERNPVKRVYRDIRFSKNKTPFKTHVSADLRRSFSDSEVLFYIHISPEQSFVAAGMWQPERAVLQVWRESISQEPKCFGAVASKLKRKNLALSSEYSLSTMPRGFQNYSDEPFASWLKLTSFVVERPLSRLECASAGLSETIVRFALDAKPLLEFGWQIEDLQRKKTDGDPDSYLG